MNCDVIFHTFRDIKDYLKNLSTIKVVLYNCNCFNELELNAYGFNRKSLVFFYSYLKWRKQCVNVNNIQGTFQRQLSKFPQGFFFNWDSLHERLNRHKVTRKEAQKRLQGTENLFRKNLQLKDVC